MTEENNTSNKIDTGKDPEELEITPFDSNIKIPEKIDVKADIPESVPQPSYSPDPPNKQTSITPSSNFFSNLSSQMVTSTDGNFIKGTDFTVDARAADLYTPINLAKAIPDANERAKYIKKHGKQMTQLINPDEYGIKFNNQISDYANFAQKQYDVKLKKFLDELDQNQGFFNELGNLTGKALGSAATQVIGNLGGLAFGIGGSIMSGDIKYLYDNGFYDLVGDAQESIDKNFVIYGGSDYDRENNNFFSRAWSHPMKTLADDIAPAAAFVVGAIGSEFLSGGLAGLAPGLSAVRGASKIAAASTSTFSKAMRRVRGLEDLTGLANARQYLNIQNKIQKGLDPLATMIRSASYESALIAKDTAEGTKLNSKLNYINNNPKLAAKFDLLSQEGKSQSEILREIENDIPESILNRINYNAENAGLAALFTNIPLVGFSNLVQFSKVFGSSYKIGQNLTSKSLNPLKGVIIKKGVATAAGESPSIFNKILGYSMPVVGRGITEGFEEFSQGVIEKGYSDYWASEFTDDAIGNKMNFIKSMTTAARNYANSIEGQDSITIGALMGMLGVALPVKIDKETGKRKFGIGAYGGFLESREEIKERIKQDEAAAKTYNSLSTNKALKNQFNNFIKSIEIQKQKQQALKDENIFQYKNKEFEEIYSFVKTRLDNGISDTIFQDLEMLKNMSLDEFNKSFAFKSENLQYTEDTKNKVLETAKKDVETIIKANQTVQDAVNYRRGLIDSVVNKEFNGLRDAEGYTESILNQMTFLYASSNNLEKREKELESKISNSTNGSADILGAINKVLVDIKGLGKKDTLQSVEFINSIDEITKLVMQEVKEKNPALLNTQQVEQNIKDLLQIKARKAKTAKIYNTLFTKKGAEDYIRLISKIRIKEEEIRIEDAKQQNAERARKAKSNSQAKAATQDEASVTNNTEATSQVVIEQLNKVQEELNRNFEDYNKATPEAILNLLETNPSLYNEITARMNQQGIFVPLEFDELDSVAATDPNLKNAIVQELKNYITEYNSKVPQGEVPNYADNKEPNEYTPPKKKSYRKPKTLEQELQNQFSKGFTVTDVSVIPVLHDRTIKDGKLQFDSKGRPKEWNINGNKSNQPAGRTLVNSANFLPNSELINNNKKANFRISNIDYNKVTERNANDISIDVYYEDTFIGRLPNINTTEDGKLVINKKPAPVNFIALREAIFKAKDNVDEKGNVLAKEEKVIDSKSFSGYETTVAPKEEVKETKEELALKVAENRLEEEQKLEFSSEELIQTLTKEIETLKDKISKEKTTPVEDVEKIAREKVIEDNFTRIVEALKNNKIQEQDNFIGQQKCD